MRYTAMRYTAVPAPRSVFRLELRHVSLPFLVAIAVVASSCGESGPTRIGGVVPQTGAASVYGQSVERGMKLAIDVAMDAPKPIGSRER